MLMKMKALLTILVLVLALSVIAGCSPANSISHNQLRVSIDSVGRLSGGIIAKVSDSPLREGGYVYGTSVVITATPFPGSIFLGWSDDCTGKGRCTLVMTRDKFVRANFISQK